MIDESLSFTTAEAARDYLAAVEQSTTPIDGVRIFVESAGQESATATQTTLTDPAATTTTDGGPAAGGVSTPAPTTPGTTAADTDAEQADTAADTEQATDADEYTCPDCGRADFPSPKARDGHLAWCDADGSAATSSAADDEWLDARHDPGIPADEITQPTVAAGSQRHSMLQTLVEECGRGADVGLATNEVAELATDVPSDTNPSSALKRLYTARLANRRRSTTGRGYEYRPTGYGVVCIEDEVGPYESGDYRRPTPNDFEIVSADHQAVPVLATLAALDATTADRAVLQPTIAQQTPGVPECSAPSVLSTLAGSTQGDYVARQWHPDHETYSYVLAPAGAVVIDEYGTPAAVREAELDPSDVDYVTIDPDADLHHIPAERAPDSEAP